METPSERAEREFRAQIRYYERQADLWERQRDTALRLGGRWPGENPWLNKRPAYGSEPEVTEQQADLEQLA